MTKSELITRISEKTGIDKDIVILVINEVNDTIVKSLSEGEEVKIAGLGTFSIVNRKAKKGRNPKTGEVVAIPPRKAAKFKPGKNLKEAI